MYVKDKGHSACPVVALPETRTAGLAGEDLLPDDLLIGRFHSISRGERSTQINCNRQLTITARKEGRQNLCVTGMSTVLFQKTAPRSTVDCVDYFLILFTSLRDGQSRTRSIGQTCF